MEPATGRPALGPLSGAGFAPLPAQAKGCSVQGPVVKPTDSTGQLEASSGRQLSYAEVGAAYVGVVAGRPDKEVTAGVESSSPLPTTKEASQEGKGGRTTRRPAEERRAARWEPLLTDTWAITRHAKQAKWDDQAHSQGYHHCAGTRCFDGSRFKAHLRRGTR
jgi:hypothetical protein